MVRLPDGLGGIVNTPLTTPSGLLGAVTTGDPLTRIETISLDPKPLPLKAT
jgi:hypothetical protein